MFAKRPPEIVAVNATMFRGGTKTTIFPKNRENEKEKCAINAQVKAKHQNRDSDRNTNSCFGK
jgi:hypothetical protein